MRSPGATLKFSPLIAGRSPRGYLNETSLALSAPVMDSSASVPRCSGAPTSFNSSISRAEEALAIWIFTSICAPRTIGSAASSI